MLYFVYVCVLAVAALTSAQDCPSVMVQTNFDIPQYTGRWYEIARVPTPFEPDGACVTATYTPQDDPVYPVNVFNRLYNERLEEYDTIEGGARPEDPDSTEAKLKVKFPVTPREANYWVLETDYDSYSLVFSCNEYNGNFTRTSWILSRTPDMDDATRQKVAEAVDRNGLDASLYVPTTQGGTCEYLPEL